MNSTDVSDIQWLEAGLPMKLSQADHLVVISSLLAEKRE